MAKMMGSVPADRWEREMYLQLKQQLPDDWVAIANVGWSRQRRSDDARYVRDGQADFVVLVPRMGMVIVEVKGSRRFRIGEDGRWYRTDWPSGREVAIDEAPPDQASRNMHELEDAVLQKGGWTSFPGLFAYVVAYPQGQLVGSPPTMHDRSTLIVASQMHDLPGRLREALSRRGPAQRGERCDANAMQRIAAILTSQALEINKADTPLDVQDDAGRIEVLTRQQFAALQGVFSHPRVAVVGPAGSGKTVLALWRLEALIEAGQRALYVCFNTALAEALQRRHPTVAQHIKSVDSFFYQVVAEAKRLPRQAEIARDRDTFFRDTLPGLVMDVVSSWGIGDRYDALIVDEGQDFGDLQLITLLDLLRSTESAYVLFADWRQDVFRRSTSGAIGAEVVFSLHHNCRNTATINTMTNRLTAGRILSMPGVPEGTEPLMLQCSDAGAMAGRAWQLAHEWHASGGQVAILSPRTLENSAMGRARIGHGLRLVTSLEEWAEKGTVYFSTIKSFKGIEATSVIVTDVEVPAEQSGFREEDLYVACTRATTRLALLSKSKDAFTWMAQRSRHLATDARRAPA